MRNRATALVWLVAIAVAGCSSSTTDRDAGQSPPEPIEHGIFLPSRWYTVSDQPPYTVTGRMADGSLHATARAQEASIEVSSQVGDPDHDEMPARCGDGTGRDFASGFDAPRANRGRSTYQATFAGNGAISITAVNPKVEVLHPKAFDTLASSVMAFTVLVDAETAAEVVAHPRTRFVLERWSHEFDDGIRLQASLSGTFTKGFRLSMTPSGGPGGQPRDVTDLGGVTCNGRTVFEYHDHVQTAYVLFIAESATGLVDGTEITDLAYDPNLMGSWAVVTVDDGHPRRVTITGSSGEELNSFELTHYDVPSD